jgi:hypothetical protein
VRKTAHSLSELHCIEHEAQSIVLGLRFYISIGRAALMRAFDSSGRTARQSHSAT